MKHEFSQQILEKFSNQIPWQSVQLGPKCFRRTDGTKDMTKLIVVLLNFAKAPKQKKKKILGICQIGKESLHKVAVNFFKAYVHCSVTRMGDGEGGV
jgi:hypothetical protein